MADNEREKTGAETPEGIADSAAGPVAAGPAPETAHSAQPATKAKGGAKRKVIAVVVGVVLFVGGGGIGYAIGSSTASHGPQGGPPEMQQGQDGQGGPGGNGQQPPSDGNGNGQQPPNSNGGGNNGSGQQNSGSQQGNGGDSGESNSSSSSGSTATS